MGRLNAGKRRPGARGEVIEMVITHARIIRRAVDVDTVAVFINGRRAGELSVLSGGGEALRRYLYGLRLSNEPPEEPHG